MNYTYLIKPLSPHLLIYNLQFSSFTSIFQRISSVLILLIILNFIILNFLSTNILTINFIIFSKWFYLSFSFFYYCILKLSLFHILNGLKIIFWIFNYLEKNLIFVKINYLVTIFFLILLFYC